MAAQLFGPEMWDVLRANPTTAALLEDAEFRSVLEGIKANPASFPEHASDPRIMQVFGALAVASGATMMGGAGANGTGTTTASKSANTAPNANGSESKVEDVEEDLDDLPEEERKVKMALREKDKGTTAYKKRDFDTAIRHYTAAFEYNPANIAPITNRAAAKFEAGDFEGAIADCHEAIKLNVENSLRTDFKVIARAWSRIGNAHMKLDQLDEAITAYQKSITEFDDDKIIKAHKAAIKLREKRDAEAYINPEISESERQEGNKMFKAGDFPGAIKKYTEAIKRNPKAAAAFNNRATAYMKLGEFPMALKDCDRCLELDPKYLKAYGRKGNIHFFMKEYHKCLEVYQKGLEIDPSSRECREGLIKTQRKIQEQQSSGEVDEEQVKHAMADPEIQSILNDAEVQTMLKQMEQDPSMASKVMRSDPVFAAKVEKLIAAGVLRVG